MVSTQDRGGTIDRSPAGGGGPGAARRRTAAAVDGVMSRSAAGAIHATANRPRSPLSPTTMSRALACAALTAALVAAQPLGPPVDLFLAYSGAPGVPTCFRQPLLVVVNASHLLAFAEGRFNGAYCSGAADGTNSSIWVRRSSDGGATWAAAAMIFDAPPQPDYFSAVYDARAGRVLVLVMASPNLQLASDDAGATWTAARPLALTLPPTVGSAVPGVAHGVQIDGALCAEPTCAGAAGRLVVAFVCHAPKAAAAAAAAQARLGDVACPGCFSCLATSDDGGATWTVAAGGVSTQEGTREASLVQLPSQPRAAAGAVVWATERNMGATAGHRLHAVSLDGGLTLGGFGIDTIPDGDTKNWTGIVAGAARVGGRVNVFTPRAPGVRADLARFVSADDAASFDAGTLFVAGPAGYSDAGALDAARGAVVYENGAAEFAQKISYAVFAA